MNLRQTNIIILALLLWNPLLILMLSKDWVITLTVITLLIIVAYLISKSKSLRLKVWAFNLCALSSIALHSELLFREFCDKKNIPNLYELHGKYYFNKPYLNQEFHTNEYVSQYQTNCQGYRQDVLSNADDIIKCCDWLFIGDSFTQGAQVNYDELYTSILFSSFPNKIIINGGISGAGLYDELNFFKDKGKQLSPKLVFLQIGVFNDFFNIKENNATYQDYLMEKSDLYRYVAYNIFSTDSLPLGRWTEPFFPTKQENTDYNILYKAESEIKRNDKLAFVKCLQNWKQEVEKIGAKLILILIPSKEQVSPLLLKQVTDRYNILDSELDLSAPNRLFASTASTLGLKSIDLTQDFQKSSKFPFFTHDEHLNIVGHKIIAERLTKELSEYQDSTIYISKGNNHERYPMFYKQDSTLLYQSQEVNRYLILKHSFKDNITNILISSFEELIHPVFSVDMRYLACTEGYQEAGETDVILYDNITGVSKKINPDNFRSAIPMFSHNGRMIAMPMWNNEENKVSNIYIYDLNRSKYIKHIKSNKECWRPIFFIDDKSILYIEKAKYFLVKQYDIENDSDTDLLELPFDIWDITISPSGRYLVFSGYKDGNWDLFCYAFETKEVRQLTHSIGNEWDPNFGATDEDLWYAGTFGFNDGIFYRRIKL